ncbi:hypothetical protein B0H16DRAFT_1460958 [Mycena metata]|uniref:Uncharacterized protein n=1 Tax=Mycena metata TaxID=1033252 RepID=A0AAD7IT08_9AGAR|nr:hypothetical protein B0H16DRAFT_1460958 [Mycena metata]
MPAPQLPLASERDAVELGAYPPSAQSPPDDAHARRVLLDPFANTGTNTAEPGVGLSPAARQAYLAAELRAAQTELERARRGANTKGIKARIRALEERQQSAWALGLESGFRSAFAIPPYPTTPARTLLSYVFSLLRIA